MKRNYPPQGRFDWILAGYWLIYAVLIFLAFDWLLGKFA